MRISRSVLFSFISPLFGLASVFYSLVSRKKISFFGLALSISLIYAYFPLLWDTRNNFFRIFLRPEDGLGLYASLISLGVFKFGLSYIAIIFALTLLTFLCYGYAMGRRLEQIRVNQGGYYYIFAFLLFFTLFEYRQAVDIQKTSLSVAIFLAALVPRREVWRWLLFLLASLIHPLMSIGIVCYLIACASFLPRWLYGVVLSVTLIAGLFLSEPLISFLLGRQEILPQNVISYLLLDESRFSSDAIAAVVKYLRVASLCVISYVFHMTSARAIDGSSLIASRLVVLSCAFALLFSFNEVSLERFYLLATAVAVYASISIGVSRRYMTMVLVAVLLNVVIHGAYTIKVVFSNDYEVLANQDSKMSLVYKLLYMPTPLLLFFDVNGASDAYLMKNANDSL